MVKGNAGDLKLLGGGEMVGCRVMGWRPGGL